MNYMRVSGAVNMGLLFVAAACSAGSANEPGDGGDGDGVPGHQDGGNGSGSGSGSGSGGDDLQHYKSGTRIKPRVLTTPDGAKVLNGWRDTMLNLDCYFSMTTD